MLDGTYTGLQATIAGFLHRTDMTAIIPDLIILGEARIARDLRLRRQVIRTTLYTVAGNQNITLPADFLEAENISVIAGGFDNNLEYVNIERLNVKYPNGSGNSQPRVYTFEANSLLLGPTPDAIYNVDFFYYSRWVALATTPANWLLTNHPNIYLFAALAEAGDYTKDNDSASKWEGKYHHGIKTLQDSDDESQFSGAALRVRTV